MSTVTPSAKRTAVDFGNAAIAGLVPLAVLLVISIGILNGGTKYDPLVGYFGLLQVCVAGLAAVLVRFRGRPMSLVMGSLAFSQFGLAAFALNYDIGEPFVMIGMSCILAALCLVSAVAFRQATPKTKTESEILSEQERSADQGKPNCNDNRYTRRCA